MLSLFRSNTIFILILHSNSIYEISTSAKRFRLYLRIRGWAQFRFIILSLVLLLPPSTFVSLPPSHLPHLLLSLRSCNRTSPSFHSRSECKFQRKIAFKNELGRTNICDSYSIAAVFTGTTLTFLFFFLSFLSILLYYYCYLFLFYDSIIIIIIIINFMYSRCYHCFVQIDLR